MKRVFISFKMEDKKQVDGVRLLAWRESFPLEFYDESVRIAYKSDHAPYIKSKIREKIARASVTVCFLQEHTWMSDWVNWELQTTLEMRKPVIAMGLPGHPESLRLPHAISGQRWWVWDPKNLHTLIEQS